MINSIENEATIGEQVVNVAATLQLEILGEGWVKIPLRLRQSAIRTATIDGQPARIIVDKSIGHQLLYEKQGDEPASDRAEAGVHAQVRQNAGAEQRGI